MDRSCCHQIDKLSFSVIQTSWAVFKNYDAIFIFWTGDFWTIAMEGKLSYLVGIGSIVV